ncbi:DUF3137 domain-containing protein [Nocardioides ferulae]|uniref:DUF3137 domain-containing protein n=1 Tax=Nocardioides ferulae TaxID=2340821 RepID=UPI000F88E474|nr:DUF3137 domain-containing protein [Nocardioides ferulae]
MEAVLGLAGGGIFFLAFAGFVALIVVLIVLSHRAEKQRVQTLTAYAAARGLAYARSDRGLVGRFDGSPFRSGYARTVSHVLRGTHDGRAFVAFDYSYKESSGTGDDRKTTTYRYAVVALHLGVTAPALSVSPENMFGRVVGRLTNSDIELESEQFNRAFTVRCPDRRFASDVLHPQMMELLLHWPDRGWRFAGDSMLVVTRGQQTPQSIDAKLHMMDAVLDAIPEFVWRGLAGGRP